METVAIYTRQHENSLYELVNKGYITNKELYVRLHMGQDADYFSERYRTFVKMAEEKVPRPEGIEFPIWGSTSIMNCLRPVDKELVYILDVPKDQVIYFDGLKWDYVLNYLYVPLNDADEERFKKFLKSQQIEHGFFIIKGKYQGLFPEIEAEIKASWPRIFTIDDWNSPFVQANLWRIDASWVRQIIHPGEEMQLDTEVGIDFDREVGKLQARKNANSENI